VGGKKGREGRRAKWEMKKRGVDVGNFRTGFDPFSSSLLVAPEIG